ncbi:hypothetical protein ACFV0T_25165 [Streptomyces sp. NPDC059582]|uniref:hypothetical protein n=1 Tax=Streptomyces sp. NPDC059582 TaxID=3346875 RepID=UPI0036C2B97B
MPLLPLLPLLPAPRPAGRDLLQVTRRADNAYGPPDLAALLGILITAAKRRPYDGEPVVMRRDVTLHELAQGLRTMSQGLRWFDSHDPEEQCCPDRGVAGRCGDGGGRHN